MYFREVFTDWGGTPILVEVERGELDICLNQDDALIMIHDKKSAHDLIEAIREAAKQIGWVV
jgi:hypothetical protein